jgi:hypothetical protein
MHCQSRSSGTALLPAEAGAAFLAKYFKLSEMQFPPHPLKLS